MTFGWAYPLRRPAKGEEALVAQIRLGPSLAVVLTTRTTEGLVATGDSVPDAFARLDAYLDEHELRPSDSFTEENPHNATDDPDILLRAHRVLAEARARHWRFEREVPG